MNMRIIKLEEKDLELISGGKLQAKVKERIEVVKKNGGLAKLMKYFYPILPKDQRLVLECLYLRPRYDGILAMSQDKKIPSAQLYKAEKVMLAKLESTDFEELKSIRARAELELELDRNAAVVSSKFQKQKMKSFVDKFGGERYLREVFMPTMEINSHKIIFEGKILSGKSDREILEELKLPSHARHYIYKTRDLVKKKLKDFKEGNPNFEQDVKDFYTTKEFERLHPENFEEVAFKVEQKEETIEERKELDVFNFGREKDASRRREFVEKYLAQFGNKKEVVRKFMPTLKRIVSQQIFLASFLEAKMDEVVRKELGLSPLEFRNEKKSIVNELEKFAKTKKSKKRNNPENTKKWHT